MLNKHMEICSTSVATRKMQLQITMRYHYTPIQMAKIKISDITKCRQECEKAG